MKTATGYYKKHLVIIPSSNLFTVFTSMDPNNTHLNHISKITTDPKWDAAFTLLKAGDQQLDTIRMVYLTTFENIGKDGHITNCVRDVNACTTMSKFESYIKKRHAHIVSWRKKVARVLPTKVAKFHDP